MSINADKWIKNSSIAREEINQEQYKLDPNKWVNTLPKKNNSFAKPRVTAIALFIIGLIFVSVIKNKTRNLQKEINNLNASINTLKLDVHQATLDHEVITSPENISRLATEYLEVGLVSYKKFQIKDLNENIASLNVQEKNINQQGNESKNNIKIKIAKKINKKRVELKKLQEIYSNPQELPKGIKLQITRKIEEKKNEIKKLYTEPRDSIDLKKIQRWGAVQVVKAFLGIPIIPGK